MPLSAAWKCDLSSASQKKKQNPNDSLAELKSFQISSVLFWIFWDISAAPSFWRRGTAQHGKLMNLSSCLGFYSPQHWQLGLKRASCLLFFLVLLCLFNILWHIYHPLFPPSYNLSAVAAFGAIKVLRSAQEIELHGRSLLPSKPCFNLRRVKALAISDSH